MIVVEGNELLKNQHALAIDYLWGLGAGLL